MTSFIIKELVLHHLFTLISKRFGPLQNKMIIRLEYDCQPSFTDHFWIPHIVFRGSMEIWTVPWFPMVLVRPPPWDYVWTGTIKYSPSNQNHTGSFKSRQAPFNYMRVQRKCFFCIIRLSFKLLNLTHLYKCNIFLKLWDQKWFHYKGKVIISVFTVTMFYCM